MVQAITRSRAANSKKEVETKANQQTTTTTSECFNVCHQKLVWQFGRYLVTITFGKVKL